MSHPHRPYQQNDYRRTSKSPQPNRYPNSPYRRYREQSPSPHRHMHKIEIAQIPGQIQEEFIIQIMFHFNLQIVPLTKINFHQDIIIIIIKNLLHHLILNPLLDLKHLIIPFDSHIRSNSPHPRGNINSSDKHLDLLTEDIQSTLNIATNENSLTDAQFLEFINYFDVGVIETANSLNKIDAASSWYVSLNIKAKTSKLKQDPNFLEIEFLLDTGATICIINLATWNAIKQILRIDETNLDTSQQTKLRTANNDLLPTNGLLHLNLFPIKENPFTLNLTFAIANTKYNILGLPFVQKYIRTIDTERLKLIFKTEFQNYLRELDLDFSQTAQKSSPYYSKIYNVTLKQHINIPGNHLKIVKFPLKPMPNTSNSNLHLLLNLLSLPSNL